MPDTLQIVLPHGGYRKLIVYRKADVIYEGTVAFCRRFLVAVRFVTQMLRIRRSGKMQCGYDAAFRGYATIASCQGLHYSNIVRGARSHA